MNYITSTSAPPCRRFSLFSLQRSAALALLIFLALSACATNPPSATPNQISALSSGPVGHRDQPPASEENVNDPAQNEPVSDPETRAPSRSVIFGTDQFINTSASPGGPAAGPGEGDVSLNFLDTDIREVVQSIMGDILGLNFLIDPAVTGTATLQTSRPVAREALLSTLEAVLRTNGTAILREGDLYKIVPVG
ncbi:MAG: hypothetical protein R3245_12935, partial [Kiloniellales bacterium]|nr:hypothetical protein [Kiloniellales bacterium]